MILGQCFTAKPHEPGAYDYLSVDLVTGDERPDRIHPFFVTLNQDSIDVFYHGPDPESDIHLNELLIRLPLMAADSQSEELSQILGKLGGELSWPGGDQGTTRDSARGGQPPPCLRLEPGRYIDSGAWPVHSGASTVLDTENASSGVWLGAIVLDLLYEFQRGTAFGGDRGILAGLLANPVAKAILAKAEYYYLRRRFARSDRDWGRRIAALELEKAERRWLNVCLGSSAQDTLETGGAWFERIETEVRRITFWSVGQTSSRRWIIPLTPGAWKGSRERQDRLAEMGYPGRDWMRKVRLIATWFVRRYDLDGAVAALVCLGLGRKTTVAFRTIQWWLPAFYLGLLVFFGFFQWKDLSLWNSHDFWRHMLPVCILLLVFALTVLVRTHRKDSQYSLDPLPFHSFRAFIVSTLCFIAALYWFADLGATERCLSLAPSRLLLAFLLAVGEAITSPYVLVLILLCVVVMLSIRSLWKRPDSRSPRIGVGVLLYRLLLPRMIVAITGAWIVLVTTEEILLAGILVDWRQIVLRSTIFLGLTALYATVQVHRLIADRRRAFGRACLVLGTGYFLSILIGALAIQMMAKPILLNSGRLPDLVVSNDRHDARTDTNTNRGALEGDLDPGRRSTGTESRIANAAAFDGLEDSWWGIQGAPMLEGKAAKAGIRRLYQAQGKPGCPLPFLMPGLLLFYSSVVVFLGLVLQLIVEDRPITEPL